MEGSKGRESRELKPLPLSALFLWGRVLRPHGLQGALLVDVLAENPQAYDRSAFWVAFPGQLEAHPYRVAFLRPDRSSRTACRWRLKLSGVADRTQAEPFRGAELYLPRTYLPPLPEGQFYYVEAIGATVCEADGSPRGQLVEIFPGPAYDFFIVRNEQAEEFWIPAPFVKGLDRANHRLYVEAPADLWDPNLARGRP
ncbi:MAG: 16S rRNA processing protein RimM [Bacteroidetes bacterium]|nr:MAG: 16S rRNA processing protein RimM [Bacteroidota bacterium]